ncbi:hypothetical protein AVEN_113138-1, partial [Araneus ventricosus]
THTGEKPFAC